MNMMTKRDMNERRGKDANANSILTKWMLVLLLVLTGGLVSEAWGADTRITYVVLNDQGKVATAVYHGNVNNRTIGQNDNFQYIASPFAKNFRFYLTATQKADGSYDLNSLADELPLGIKCNDKGMSGYYTIYVRYEKADDFNNQIGYWRNYLMTDSWTIGYKEGTEKNIVKASTYAEYFTNAERMWRFDGDDPYDLRLINRAFPDRRLYRNSDGMLALTDDTSVDELKLLLLPNKKKSGYYIMVAAGMFSRPNFSDENNPGCYEIRCWDNTSQVNVRVSERTNGAADPNGQGTSMPVIPEYNYTYKVKNLSNNIAVQATERKMPDSAIEIPNVIKSPLATNYTYYSDAACTTPITELPSSDADIYVKYDVNPFADVVLNTDAKFDFKFGGKYMTFVGGSTNEFQNSDTPTNQDLYLKDKNDPYNISIKISTSWWVSTNGDLTDINTLKNNGTRVYFSIVNGASTGSYEFLASKGADSNYDVITGTSYRIGYDDTNKLKLYSNIQHGAGSDAVQAQIIAKSPSVTYHILDLAGREAIRKAVTGQSAGLALDKDAIPEDIRSPYIANNAWKFYRKATLTGTDDSEGNRHRNLYSVSEDDRITELGSGQAHVFVTYTYDAANCDYDLSGSKKYYMHFEQEGYISVGSFGSNMNTVAIGNGGGLDCFYDDGKTYPTFKHYSTQPTLRWILTGDDPYHIVVQNNGRSNTEEFASTGNGQGFDMVTKGSRDYGSFILLDAGDGKVRLLANCKDNDAMEYVCHYTTKQTRLYRQNQSNYQYSKFTLELAIIYHVINLSGKESIKGAGYVDTSAGTKKLSVPFGIKSPLIEDSGFKYYRSSQFNQTKLATGEFELNGTQTPLTELPDGVTDIYVMYSSSDIKTSDDWPSLDGTANYNIQSNGYYWYYKSDSDKRLFLTNSPTDADKISGRYKWHLDNNDPYDVIISNMSNNQVLCTTVGAEPDVYVDGIWSVKRFVILQRPSETQGEFELSLATPTDNSLWSSNYSFCSDLQYVSHYSDLSRATIRKNSGHLDFKTTFTKVEGCTYFVINKSGKKAIQYEERHPVTIALPAEYTSPLATDYKYYDESQFADNGDGTYTIKSGEEANDLISQGKTKPEDQQVIYVVYSTVTDGKVKLDGTTLYNIVGNSTSPKILCQGYHGQQTERINLEQSIEFRPPYYQWTLLGATVDQDPYDVTIKNVGYAQYIKADDCNTEVSNTSRFSSVNTHFMLLKGTGDFFEIAKLRDDYQLPLQYEYVYDGYNVDYELRTTRKAAEGHGTNWTQFQIRPALEYKVVTLEGDLSVNSTEPRLITKDETTPLIPDVIVSPLIKDGGYKYYDISAFEPVGADGKYRLKSDATPLTHVSDATSNDIYIKYTEADILTTIDLTGSVNYNISVNPTSRLTAYRNGNNVATDNTEVTESTLHTKDYTWKLVANGDPYAIKVYNSDTSAGFIGADDGQDNYKRNFTLTSNAAAYPNNTFAILKATDSDGYVYKLMSTHVSTTAEHAKRYQYFGHRENNIALVGLNNNEYRPDVDYIKLKISTFTNTYVYHIIDTNGRDAIKYTIADQPVEASLNYTAIPSVIRSPYLEHETLTFYQNLADAQADNGENTITTTPIEDNSHIYVRYTTDHRTDFALNLGSARSFDIRVNGKYVYDDDNKIENAAAPATDGEGDTKHEYLWYVMGDDPYAVQIENVNDKKHFTFNTSDESINLSGTPTTKFIVTDIKTSTRTVDGNEIEDILVELMAATGEDAATQYFNIGRGNSDEDNVKLYNNTDAPQGDDRLRVVLNVAKLHISYCLVDLSGKVILEIPAGDEIEKNFPAEWRSPLATNFQYWIAENFKNPGSGTFELKESQTEITSLAESVDGKVYVTYEATADVDLDGRKKVEDNQEGKMYLLKFKNGVSFVQENGKDGFNPSATKAVYPYNNGEVNLYIYGDEQWEEQQLGAASTRTRWAWYVEGGDPYRARFSSFQAQASSNAYLRTYQPDGYSKVVTGVITKNSSVSAAQAPTDYMILGSDGNYKLVTTELIGDSHVTVNSFEQYWKNNPTALNILLEDKGLTAGSDAAKAYAEQLNSRDLTPAEKAALSAKGWHSYKAWANINSWTSTSGKTYQYTDHWFQTISMDNGGSDEPVFDFVPIDLDGVLVLLDNHGWEIMRKPMARKDADNATERNDAIRVYDSPMVERYYFYYNYSKVPGYHKYKPTTTASKASDNVKKVGTGTSLADYVNYYSALSNNGTLRDVYVTYDVKAQYADAYTNGQTFVIRQDSKLASTTDGENITPVDVPAELDNGDPSDITDEKLHWYLKPNADIDDEMGITYSQSTTDEDGNEVIITKDKAGMQADYEADGQNGFDPYNLRIESKAQSGKYFTTDANNASLSGGVWTSTSGSSVSLTNATVTYNAEGHDATICKVSNATFLAVQDKNGNLRFMPRFDHSKVIEGFTTLASQAVAQSFDDKTHPQTTLLYQPNSFTYIVIDNQGREALHYTTVSSGAPDIPYKFMSPLATGFSFYQGLTKTGDTYDLTGIESKRITGSFSAAGMTSGNVYVRYSYDSECDPTGLLKGNWLTMQVNGTDVKNDGGTIKSGGTKVPTQTEWQWRLIQSASGTPDPYAINIYTATDAAAAAVSVNGTQRFVLLPHSSGAATDYALLVAGSESTSTYNFLNGNTLESKATTATETNFATKGLITEAAKVTFADEVVAPYTSLQYKIVTLGGQIALTGDSLVHTSQKPSLPHWMRSPLMKKSDDTYTYYAGVTRDANGKYTAVNPTGTLKNLDIEDGKGVVYVRYDYTKSRTSTDLNGRGEKSAVLDLTGKVPYAFFLDDWQCAHEVTSEPAKKDLVRSYSNNSVNGNVKMLWHFTGNDPYEIKISNVYQGEDLFISSPAEDDARFRPGVEAPETEGEWYPLVVQMKPDNDTDYPDNTFMVLPYPKDNNLALYVTGSQRRFLIQRGAPNDPPHVRVFMDNTDYSQRVKEKTTPKFGNDGNAYFYPCIQYHVITNEGKEVFSRSSRYEDKTMEIPEAIASPLIAKKDFIYYSDRPAWDGKVLTTNEDSRLSAGESILTLTNDQLIGDVYIRYNYTPEGSPIYFHNDTYIPTDPSGDYSLAWYVKTFLKTRDTGSSDYAMTKGLDLTGNTWYNMTDLMSPRNNKGQFLYYENGSYKKTEAKSGIMNAVRPSNMSSKGMLWRFDGNDPYAIRIYNCAVGNTPLFDGKTFALVKLYSNDAQSDGSPILSAVGTWWYAFMETGSEKSFLNTSYSVTAASNWGSYNTDGYIFNTNSTDRHFGIYKAPVARKYRYHAVQYDGETKVGETWTATLEHDWLMPVVLEDEIARLYCKYEQNTVGTGDDVTGSNDFATRKALEASANAQFYSDAAMTKRVFDEDATTHAKTYDVYPAIDTDDVYDIYFKYQLDEEAVVSGRKWSDLTSTTAAIADDVANRKENGILKKDDIKANWFFMVLDTDEDITATGTGKERKFTGKQRFLRREDNGAVGWMDNAYELHKETADNYHEWSYNRLAENYRKGENDAFREGRWLWAFVGDDPYNLRVLNMETAVGVDAEGEGIYELKPADNCWATITEVTDKEGDKSYPVTIPSAEPAKNYTWGITQGRNFETEQTFNLLSTAMTHEEDGMEMNQLLYWQMAANSTAKTDSVAGMSRSSDRQNAIQLLRYEPTKYEDVQIVIRRKDEVDKFRDKKMTLDDMTTGIAKLYYAAHERKFVAGDKIDLSDKDNMLPFHVRRAFCDYALYKSDEPFDEIGSAYTVKAGPYPDLTQPQKEPQKDAKGNYVYDDDGNQIYNYVYDDDGHQIYKYFNVDADGNFTGEEVTSGAQAVYAHYVVTSDIFLQKAPNKEEVKTMADNNDHVFFMDFPDQTPAGTQHAYYDPQSTMFERTGNLKEKIDKTTGTYRTEKKKWDDATKDFVDDQELIYNTYQYRTDASRMISVPERLKWYFVGDPYKVQVYNTASEWASNNDKTAPKEVAAQLARFNETETNFQFVVDCVHLRVPDYSNIDNRAMLTPTDSHGNKLPESEHHNRHQGEPYFNDFYWEVVEAASDVEGTFALRFKEDNDLLGYRNVYYYLAHDGLSKTYVEDGKSYKINLSYNPDNKIQETGDYPEYHAANNKNTIIRLVQPAKVYVTAKKNDTAVVTDELSEYYGVGEKISEVPRHLQRKFVEYDDWTDKELTESNADNTPLASCSGTDHGTIRDLMPAESRVDKLKVNPIYKFDVNYTVNDITNDGVHLFSTDAENPQWVDMTVGYENWLYYDKKQDDHTVVSNYRTAVNDNKANGWTDGVMGLHWALVGDPYDFTIMNRRSKEAGYAWLQVNKIKIANYKGVPNDSVIWTTSLAKETTDVKTSEAIASAAEATHFSTQMWKLSPTNSDGTYQTGNADSCYFLRTASLKQSDTEDKASETNNYWRMVMKPYPSTGDKTSYFEMVPYSLAEKSSYTGSQYAENYSQTMSGLGVYQQRLKIRTAVAKDKDDADNNCFDADVAIVSASGEVRLLQPDMEIRYGDVQKSLPYSLRRYGCTYTCYLDDGTGKLVEVKNFGELEGEEGYDALQKAMAATEKDKKVQITYVYEVEPDIAQHFTTEQDAKTDDYTWMNTYFQWMQTYSGTSVEVERTRREFSHYVYNAAGEIETEVWIDVPYVEVVNNPTTPYETKGYLNTHTSQTPVYADETTQSENDRQKWSLTGDPYAFTMKNYAQYLQDHDATVAISSDGAVITQNYDGQQFALAVNKDGTPYLAVIDTLKTSNTYGTVTKLVDFEFSSTSNKSLDIVGDGVNLKDPTGNSLAITYTRNGKEVKVKPFHLASLIKYADVLIYHLVMAHQHSLEDKSLTEDQEKEVNKKLYEFLKYWGIRDHENDSTYFLNYTAGVPTGYKESETDNIKALLKQKGTLRDFLSYPVEDQEVSRVGIGNSPLVPWYMKRQFCTYYMYQRDVLRSKVDYDSPAWLKNEDGQYVDKDGKVVDEKDRVQMTFMENGIEKPAYNIEWVSIFDVSRWSDWGENDGEDAKHEVTADEATTWGNGLVAGEVKKIPSGYNQALSYQGKNLEKLLDCHENRKVIIDVVYEVNTSKFQFADKGRNTTAWYSMMTNNDVDGLMNFSYLHSIGARQDKTHHYTNNYLWAPEGDPYGFVLRSRYATINGTGWNDVAVTTKGKLPKKGEDDFTETPETESMPYPTGYVPMYQATYTGSANSYSAIPFNNKRIIHRSIGQDEDATTDGATNAVYEMFVGGFDNSFLMHPTAAWMDNKDADYQSYYMKHDTEKNTTVLTKKDSKSLLNDKDANWRLVATPEQLIPYFKRAGYVGGLEPQKAQDFTNQNYMAQLQQSIDSKTELSFSTLRKIQQLVYGGTFKDKEGKVVEPETERSDISLPMTFESTNLINMTPGYYRIQAFSEEALNTDGKDLRDDGDETTDDVGVVGPRYISGYRFESETRDPKDESNDKDPDTHGRWLHFFETDMLHSTIHTFEQLKKKIDVADKSGVTDRDQFDHTAMRGNIEILPADFDPSSIFQFSSANSYNRYVISTQDMELHARAGRSEKMETGETYDADIKGKFGKTELNAKGSALATGFDNRFRLDDIGGAAMTLRTFSTEPEPESDKWDKAVAENLKTNYLCIDRNHRYRITCHTDNEMVEIGDHYTTDGYNGIQDTKWLLQRVGNHEGWPYNEMPLRVEVQKGGVKDQSLTGDALSADANKDPNYYGTLYVPFDSRLSNTTDVAYTLVNDVTAPTEQLNMKPVSKLNNMGNPQYVPAGMPVVLRTSQPNEVTLKNQDPDAPDFATRHYVNMFLPYDEPQTGIFNPDDIKLKGEYLERKLTDAYIPDIEDKTIMVFGLPFKGDGEYSYDYTQQVGFYANKNWWREKYPDVEESAIPSQTYRDSLYVYHNRAYYVYSGSASSAPTRLAVWFEGDPEPAEQPIQDAVKPTVPWPCDVYDLQGRKVAEQETPQTLLKNYPTLSKGVYIFGGRKVIVK